MSQKLERQFRGLTFNSSDTSPTSFASGSGRSALVRGVREHFRAYATTDAVKKR